MSAYIDWLDGEESTDVARVGGKAASLARLARAGFPVPPGFAVTVDAYRAFDHANGLGDALGKLEAISGRPTMAQVREACEPIRERLVAAPLPPAVSQAISDAFKGLQARTGPEASFAVRSSGVSEDSAHASFAGLYESYLNLAGEEAVLDAVLKCYQCLWHPRAAHYRTVKGVGHAGEAMATVVMQTVRSLASGVAFTMNPVTGSRDEFVINASWGLGEAVVSGMVTPDHITTDREGTISHQEIARKSLRFVPTEHGTEREDTPEALATAPSLTPDQVRRVAITAAEVEQEYGRPVDIEFAFDEQGMFYLLQARPITTR